ncbi:hypothetical protein [Bombilactobacillus thymidiniphilus]|uniref:ABC transporter permease n=1 Tax=Bombilactobacillus thymidiniphilus TaxID=2923363 RepID=A0ABY4PE80_9LACO|nr:hypothetical protein [Bombilactobacillus thymidiniphilus]UQS84088.1 hypothetical protein MOO47_02740 [Bombilactobacillus thymidiniphilus]
MMTKWGSVLTVTFKEQFKLATQTLLINLLVLVISTVYFWANSGRKNLNDIFIGDFILWSFIFLIVAFIRILRRSLQHARSNRFRLLPIADWKLYLAQITSATLSFAYFCLVDVILGILLMLAEGVPFSGDFMSVLNIFASFIIWLIIGLIIGQTFWLAFIQLISFCSNLILQKIPGGSVTIVKVAIYVVVAFICMFIYSLVSNLIPQDFLLDMSTSNDLKLFNGLIWMMMKLDLLVFVLTAIVVSINAYIFSKLETNR